MTAVACDRIAGRQCLGTVQSDGVLVLLDAVQAPASTYVAAEFEESSLDNLLQPRLRKHHLVGVTRIERPVWHERNREVRALDATFRLHLWICEEAAQVEDFGRAWLDIQCFSKLAARFESFDSDRCHSA